MQGYWCYRTEQHELLFLIKEESRWTLAAQAEVFGHGSWWKEKFSWKLWVRLLWSHCPTADIAAFQPKSSCLRAVGWGDRRSKACISKAEFPGYIPSYININNSLGKESFIVCFPHFPYVFLQRAPSHPALSFFFPVDTETQFKKFLLLNSLSSPVALRPPVRTDWIILPKHEQFARKMDVLPGCAAPLSNGRSVGLCLVPLLTPTKGSGWKSQKQISGKTRACIGQEFSWAINGR